MNELERAVWAAVYARILTGHENREDAAKDAREDDHARISMAIDAAHDAVLNLRAAIGTTGAEFGLKLRASNREFGR